VTASRRTRVRRTLRLAAHLGVGWVGAAVAPRLAPARRRRLARRLARRTLAILDVRLIVHGTPPRRGPCLLVANHVSWLDVWALGAVCDARFVAKSEVRTWPVAGRIARGFDTLFIRRGSFRDAARVKDRVAAALAAGEIVAVFPEGTTTDGARVRPFHAALLQAAVDAAVSVQPVALRYPDVDGRPHPGPAFVGDTSFVASLRRVLRLPALRARLVFGEPIPAVARREVALRAQTAIARALGVPVDRPTHRTPPRPLAAAG
jgi:1-acyl-sn-glycerol-3-phosphate acyltransferase